MKKAFTMMELIFVLIVMGILAAVIMPRMERDPVREAAIQLVSHIRYTQHLALVDDKYDASDDTWYKKRWELMFEKDTTTTNDEHSYTIFSDTSEDGNANAISEIATNPQDKSKKLTGGTNALHYDDIRTTSSMNIGTKYGITDIDLSSSCQFYNSKKITFDHLGRPLIGSLTSYTSPYPSASRLMSSDCNITLVGSTGSVTITVTPETGYTYIAN